MKRVLLTSLLLAVVACEDGGTPTPAPEASGPTWHGEVAALVTTHCAGCHRAGGAAPFALDTYADAQPLAAAIVDSVAAGRMPPWNPDPDCRTYENQRVLPADALATLTAWADARAPEGVDTGVPLPAPARVAFEPDLVTTAGEPYLPPADTPDDYRCLVLDAEFEHDTYVRGFEVVPDQGPLVHHVLLYAIPPSDVPALEALDAEHDGPGYACFGGIEVGLPSTQGGWVPGGGPSVWSQDRASFVPAGSKLVMQVHYNLGASPPAPDQTAVRLMTTTQPPASVVSGQPLATFDLHIPANDAAASITRDFTWYGDAPFEIVGVAGHMHLLGTRMSVSIIRAEDDAAECMLDIPKWDFAWQEMFVLGEPMTLRPGDRVRLSCSYDNSTANQPVVNGEQLMPRDVEWGEGTLDEMCYASLIRATPREDATSPDDRCVAAAACRAECEDPDSLSCVARCVGDDRSCGQCMIGALARCGGASCINALTTARTCLTECLMFGGDPDACMTDRCPDAYDAVDLCLSDATAAEGCPAIDACE